MELSNFFAFLLMRVFQRLLTITWAIVLLVTGFPAAAQAASSAAIRAYDDAEAVTKNFAGQNLIRSEFSDAKLESANFEGADLRGAVFNGAILKNANLHGVDFSDGIAYVSSFVGADLTDAVLTSAMLLKSNFRDAKITGADFSLAMLDRTQVLQLCKTASGTNPVTAINTRESLGCR
jgi:uncharacterized protein YjbI with pentapeptide repeats